MPFSELPVEIVSQIIGVSQDLESPNAFLRLRKINRVCNDEVTRRVVRIVYASKMVYNASEMAESFLATLLGHMVRTAKSRQNPFFKHIIAICEYLRNLKISFTAPSSTDETCQLDYWIDQTCFVMASSAMKPLTLPWHLNWKKTPVEGSAFITAIRKEHLDIIDAMIQAGSTATAFCPYLNSHAAESACRSDTTDVINKLLLATKEKSEEEISLWSNCLVFAISERKIDLVRTICDHSPKSRLLKHSVRHAISGTIKTSAWETYRVIVETHQDLITVEDQYRYNVLMYQDAARKGYQALMWKAIDETMRLGPLLKCYDFLVDAMRYGFLDICQFLFDQDLSHDNRFTTELREDLKSSFDSGQLRWGRNLAEGNCIGTFRLFEDRGLHVGFEGFKFMLAVSYGSTKVVEYVARAGVDDFYDDVDHLRYSAFVVAAARNNFNMTRLLVRIFSSRQKSRTELEVWELMPLTAAIDAGSLELARILIQSGAFPEDMTRFRRKFSKKRREARRLRYFCLMHNLRLDDFWTKKDRIRWPEQKSVTEILDIVIGCRGSKRG